MIIHSPILILQMVKLNNKIDYPVNLYQEIPGAC